MARYTGPKDKIARRYNVTLFGPTKYLERKNYPPGQHGPKGSRRKSSEYSVALAEKQKLRYQYGLLERQFRKFFEIASRKRGVTGEILLQLLETRLDSVVYKLGFANSRNSARQLVGHGHVHVNGRKCTVSSRTCNPGDVIVVKERECSRRLVMKNMELTSMSSVPDWLTVDKEHFTGKVARIPTREEIAPIVNEQLIVELYSKA
jgi:small subunit ribosomal protein S4